MLRLVTEKGEPAAPDGRKGKPARSTATPLVGKAAVNFDCGIEMSACIAVHLVEGMIRAKLATCEQGEVTLTRVADGLEALIARAPDELSGLPEWIDLRRRIQASSLMVRDAVFDLMLRSAR